MSNGKMNMMAYGTKQTWKNKQQINSKNQCKQAEKLQLKKCKHETGSWMAQTDIQSATINIKLINY